VLSLQNAVVLAIDFQARIMQNMEDHKKLEKKAETFLRCCRILDLPILTMQQYTKGLGDTVPAIKEALGEFEHIEKLSFSCRGSEEFTEKLKKTGRKNILVTGIESHICVQQTVLHLLEDGYNVYVIADCTGSRYKTDRKYAEERMRRAGAVITTMESALFEMLERSDHPKRKDISGLVK